MSGVQLEGLITSDLLKLLRVRCVTLTLLHHLHHYSHGARHLSRNDCRSISQSLGNSDFTDVLRELVFHPKAKASNIFFREFVSKLGFSSQIFA
jgi:hypothetical protein